MSGVFVFAGVESESDGPLVIEDVKPLACRCCLAVERPLRPLERALASLYEQLTGTPVSQSDVYPKFLCSYCRALLLKFSAFRTKCLSIQETFLNFLNAEIPITTEFIKSEVTGAPFQNLQATAVQLDSYDPSQLDLLEDSCVNSSTQLIKKECIILGTEPLDSAIENNESTSKFKSRTAKYSKVSIIDAADDEKLNLIADEASFSDDDNNVELEHSKDDSDTNDGSDFIISGLKKYLTKTYAQSEAVKKGTMQSLEDSIYKCKKKAKRKSKQHLTRNKNITKKTRDTKSLKNVVKNTHSSQKTKITTENVSKGKQSKLDVYFQRRRENSEKNFNVKYVCLTKEEQIKQVEARKSSVNYKLAIYKCGICYRGFRMELAYKTHMLLHDPSRGDHVCEVCHMRFPHKRELAHHEYLTHRYNLVCNECGHVTKTSCHAGIHYRQHRGVKYPCKICGKTFEKPNRVWDHMNVAHEGALACSICDEKFIGQNGLRVHMNRVHKEAAGAVCPSCGVQFHSHDALRRHRPQDGSCDPTHRPCAACGEGFLTDETLQQHKQEHHTKKGFKCTVCGKVLHSKVKYRNHVNNHISKNKTQLSEQEVSELKGSRVCERAQQVFMCEMCGFSVKNSIQALEKHRRTHTGEKLFQCEICQKRFTTKRYLGVHTAKHMGIVLPKKTYLCRFCDKPFNHQGNRDKHEKGVHQKLRPFECGICEKSFQSKDSMQNHVNHTHQGVPWPKRTRKREGAYSEAKNTDLV